jgi:hypothetical protein
MRILRMKRTKADRSSIPQVLHSTVATDTQAAEVVPTPEPHRSDNSHTQPQSNKLAGITVTVPMRSNQSDGSQSPRNPAEHAPGEIREAPARGGSEAQSQARAPSRHTEIRIGVLGT